MRGSAEARPCQEERRRIEAVKNENVAETNYARSCFHKETKLLEPFAKFRAGLNLKRPAASLHKRDSNVAGIVVRLDFSADVWREVITYSRAYAWLVVTAEGIYANVVPVRRECFSDVS